MSAGAMPVDLMTELKMIQSGKCTWCEFALPHPAYSGCDARIDPATFMVGGLPYRVEVANTLAKREEAYRLIYDVYSQKGYGEPHPSGLWFKLHDLLPGTVTLVVSHGEEIVAAVTLVADSEFGMPIDDVYPEEIRSRRERGQRMTEVMSLGVKPGLRNQSKLVAKLVNFVCMTALFVQRASHLVITVVPGHASFYQRMMLFDEVGKAGYHEKTGVSCLMLSLPLNVFHAMTRAGVRTRTVYHHYGIAGKTENALAAEIAESIRPLEPSEVSYLLSKRPELWKKAAAARRAFGIACSREHLACKTHS